jgi:hypothetical protein
MTYYSSSRLTAFALTAIAMTLPAAAQAAPKAAVKWGTPAVPEIGTVAAEDVKSTINGDTVSVTLKKASGVNLTGTALTGASVTALELPVTPVAPGKIAKYTISIRAAAKKTARARLALMIDTGSSTWTVEYGYGQTAPSDLIIPITAKYTGAPLTVTITETAQRKFPADTAQMLISGIDVTAVAR